MTSVAAEAHTNTSYIPPSDARPTQTWRVVGPLALAAGYQWFLCLGLSFGLPVSQALIGGAEAALLVLFLSLGMFTVSSLHVGVAFGILVNMAILWALRGGEVDVKPLRDIFIVLIAFWYGTRLRASVKLLDQSVLLIGTLVVLVGLLEYTGFYSKYINTFEYYARTGAIDPSSAMIEGQTVTLNGLRPEGIGRTLMPWLLGQERISSIFLEPVSMGNFGVIIAAWAIAKPKEQWKSATGILAVALVVITLADSRFGIVTVCLMTALRLMLRVKAATAVAFCLPFLAAAGTVLMAALTNQTEDNFAGRLAYSGKRLLELDASSLLGISGFDISFWDSGYGYVVTRFGLTLLIVLWVGFFLIPLKHNIAARFRVSMSVYLSLILCISGSSAFAFKTSVVLWVLFGASKMLSDDPIENRNA